MAFASAGWTCSTDIQRQRGPRHLFPVTGKRYLGHHNSRLPSELPGPADPKGVSREHARPIKTVKVDFVKTFERRRRPRVLSA